MAGVQHFYTYARLADMWLVKPSTVQMWVQSLRKTDPKRVVITYRLVNGYRRTAMLAYSTAKLLQDRHFPINAMPKKHRPNPPEHVRMAREPWTPPSLAPAGHPAAQARRRPSVDPRPSAPNLGAPAVTGVRRIPLPPMPSRYDKGRERPA